MQLISTTVPTALSADRRCRACTLIFLVAGLLPLTLMCWLATTFPGRHSLSQMTERAERDAKVRLTDAGLASLSLRIRDGVGVIIGELPAGATSASAFQKAEDALSPMTGIAGIVDRLENHVASGGDAPVKH
jgi:hypothetical protein